MTTTEPPITTQRALATACGASARTVRRWIGAGMPGGKKGPWNVEQILQWVRRMRSAGARRGPGAMETRVGDEPAPLDSAAVDDLDDDVDAGGDADMLGLPANGNGKLDDVDIATLDSKGLDLEAKRAAVGYRMAKAARERLLLEQLRGDLIERAAIERLLTARAMELRRDLLTFGKRLAPVIAGLDLRDTATRLDAEGRRMLTTYSRAADIDALDA